MTRASFPPTHLRCVKTWSSIRANAADMCAGKGYASPSAEVPSKALQDSPPHPPAKFHVEVAARTHGGAG
eukprot:12935547-Prorocentrum_lima.AAC.1